MSNRKPDKLDARCRELAIAAGQDPDARVEVAGKPRGMPAWCSYRDQARAEYNKSNADALAASQATATQDERYKDAQLTVIGNHDEGTVQQMKNCMTVGNVLAGVICADGHLGYAQPVGGVIAYEDQVSISGVGFDIGCGNMAARLGVKYDEIAPRVPDIARAIATTLSFGVGRTNDERVEHALFDDDEAWKASDREDFKQKARAQLGTIGSGNHYVDLFRDEKDNVWIGVHFGSRGLGHTSATKYLQALGAKDGIHVPPAVVDAASEVGTRYIAAMELAGRYAYAGREWVVEKVRSIVGGEVLETVHNHHNYAWRETVHGKDAWVVRKGATPAFPGQQGFVGGSMGDDAVILEGVETDSGSAMLHSTVHGAGRLFGRKEAKRRFARAEMDQWLRDRGVTLLGGDLDESPMAYRRLPDVLAAHQGTVRVLHTLRPIAVVMAGSGEVDPYKD